MRALSARVPGTRKYFASYTPGPNVAPTLRPVDTFDPWAVPYLSQFLDVRCNAIGAALEAIVASLVAFGAAELQFNFSLP